MPLVSNEKQLTLADLEGMWKSRDVADHFGITVGRVVAASRRGVVPGAHKVLRRWYYEKEVVIAEWKVDIALTPGFKEGNTLGKGNTLGIANKNKGRLPRKTEEKYLRSLSKTVTPEDWMAIIKKAVIQAKSGEWRARQWLSDYLMGKPVQRVAADVSVVTTRVFAKGERAAAVEALLAAVRQREERQIVDIEPNAITSTTAETNED